MANLSMDIPVKMNFSADDDTATLCWNVLKLSGKIPLFASSMMSYIRNDLCTECENCRLNINHKDAVGSYNCALDLIESFLEDKAQ